MKKYVPPATKFRRYLTMPENTPDFAALNPGYGCSAVFLASDAAKTISGQVLPIDNDRQRA